MMNQSTSHLSRGKVSQAISTSSKEDPSNHSPVHIGEKEEPPRGWPFHYTKKRRKKLISKILNEAMRNGPMKSDFVQYLERLLQAMYDSEELTLPSFLAGMVEEGGVTPLTSAGAIEELANFLIQNLVC
jgi:hypothetical protein